jgi:isoquinoline 1-oxidoreductase subunit alpha
LIPFFISLLNTHQGPFLMTDLIINGKKHSLDVEPEMPLLWVIRDEIGLTGTKYGCGVAQCGACTVLVDGAPVRSCSFPNAAAQGKHITTIEGLSPNASHPVQLAWKDLDVPQCGYCQSGQILAAAALLKRKPKPTDQDIDEAMTNICRCGSYRRIRAGIHQAAKTGLGINSVIHMVPAGAGLSAQNAHGGEDALAACAAGCQHNPSAPHDPVALASDQSAVIHELSQGFSSHSA